VAAMLVRSATARAPRAGWLRLGEPPAAARRAWSWAIRAARSSVVESYEVFMTTIVDAEGKERPRVT
jgi:hypothetical protein